MAESKVWARDRATGKVEEHTAAFVAAWPNSYLRVDPPKTKTKRESAPKTRKRAVRAASAIPAVGTNTEGGA